MKIGKTPPRGDIDYWSNAIFPWVSISDMTEYGTISNTKEKISLNAANRVFKSNFSSKGSLLMSFKLTVGRTSILGIDAFHNEAIITILPFVDRTNISRDYLFHTLPILAKIGNSKDAIKGKTLNSKSLFNLLIPLPPLCEQKRIVEEIKSINNKIKA